MRVRRAVWIVWLLAAACASPSQAATPATESHTPSPIVQAVPAPALPPLTWAIYSPDPDHLWNRLYRQLYRRRTAGGEDYGLDALDPLLWPETTYLLQGNSYGETLAVLDEFLTTGGERLVADPLKRAVFQRDLWAVFDWLGTRSARFPEQSQALRADLAQIILRVALPKAEIAALPDNYAAAVASQAYPAQFQTAPPPGKPYLPGGLFAPEGGWVMLGRAGGPIAMSHTESFPFFGRSAFLVFVRAPGGRAATLDFIDQLNGEKTPDLPAGLEVALVRRMLLIDDDKELVLSPLVESVGIRYFPGVAAQWYFTFALERGALFADVRGGLVPLQSDYPLFFTPGGDAIDLDEAVKAGIPQLCIGCHQDSEQVYGVSSILSYSRARFPLPAGGRPVLMGTSAEDEGQVVVNWKAQDESWRELQAFFELAQPPG